MNLFKLQWLNSPRDRDIIGATSGIQPPDPVVELPVSDVGDQFAFVMVGDTGDAPIETPRNSALHLVAERLAGEMGPPVGDGRARMLIHLGDVVYLTGEKRLYSQHFGEPYTPFLEGGLETQPLKFRVPFLAVPGNHDYYDLAWLPRILVRLFQLRGFHHNASRVFGRNLPFAGSHRGRVFRQMFLGQADRKSGVLKWAEPQTSVPGRYYRFRVGNTEFFALDSNTLDASDDSQTRAEQRIRAAATEEKLRPQKGRVAEMLQANVQAGGISAHQLQHEWIDRQREAAGVRVRATRADSDFDEAQLRWLDAALERSEREHPDGWRILYLHHPLYTTTTNHCESEEVVGVRENLQKRLAGRVHLVVSGHSHAFEWIRSPGLGNTALIVSGGGGVSLRPSVLDPREHDNPEASVRLRKLQASEAGECVFGGVSGSFHPHAGPAPHHYLRVEVTPESIRVVPVGVIPGAADSEPLVPMPVFHSPDVRETGTAWQPRRLQAIVIRRDTEPRPDWA